MIMLKDDHVRQLKVFLQGVVSENAHPAKVDIAKQLLYNVSRAEQGYPGDKDAVAKAST